jgi:predicted GNAT superfamily acetyltransferase
VISPFALFETAMQRDLTLRPFSSHRDYHACTELQEEVWGRGFSEKVSAAILMIANRIGGLAAGAFAGDGTLQGFVFGLTGVMDGKLVHWSDMLAVRSEGRDLGLGTQLKRYQREVLLGRDVGEMRWTFDPLQGRNAFVNFSKLGIVSREYVENMYGETDSPLHRGVGTDRLVAVWELGSERVKSRLSRERGGPSIADCSHLPRILPVLEGGSFPSPGAPIFDLDDPALLLAVPEVIDTIMENDLPLAIRWRDATRKLFLHYFSRGYEVREFIRGEGVSFYLMVGPGGRVNSIGGEDAP